MGIKDGGDVGLLRRPATAESWSSLISLSQIKDEFDQLNLYCYCLFGINGFVLFLCSLVISSRMLNHKTCYLLLMICTFLTAIVFLVILGLTVGISFTKGKSILLQYKTDFILDGDNAIEIRA